MKCSVPRTICGIGRGDSALRVTGGTPSSLATLSACMGVIKELVEGRETPSTIDPSRFPGWTRVSWTLDGRLRSQGARRSAGAKADGLIMQLADPFIVKWAVETALRARASEAGRSDERYKVCVAAPAYVGDDLAHQRDQVRWFGGMVGNHVADIVERYGSDNSVVPPALTDYIKGRKGYDYSHHGQAGNPDAEFVPDEIIDRFCVFGSAAAASRATERAGWTRR